MREQLKSVLLKSVARGLHGLEARITHDQHKQGGIQRLLERTWFDPQIRPFSIDTVNTVVRTHGFTRITVMVFGSPADATVRLFRRSSLDLKLRLATFHRTLTRLDDQTVEPLSPQLVRESDAVVVLDSQPEEYLNVLRFCYEHRVDCPVITDFTRLPWVGGQGPLYAGDLESTVYVHHHFGEVFGIRDPLQFYYEILDGGEVKAKGFHVLGPNQTIRLSTKALKVGRLRHGMFWHVAYHPGFAKIPHRRFRTVIDVQNASSQCQHHGLELKRELVSYAGKGGAIDVESFRLGPNSDVLFTAMRDGVPSASSDEPLRIWLTGRTHDATFTSSALTVVPPQRSVTASVKELFGRTWSRDEEVRLLVSFSGPCDRLCWMSIQQAGERTRLSGNHGFQAPRAMAAQFGVLNGSVEGGSDRAKQKALADLAAMRAQGVMLWPFAIPVFPQSTETGLESAVNFANSLPLLKHFQVVVFDAAGQLCDRREVALSWDRYTFLDTAELVPTSVIKDGGLLLIAPIYERENLLPDECKLMCYVRIRDRQSGDYDYTERQDSWRNIPGYFPKYPSNVFSGRARARKNRTSLMIRAVHDGDSVCQLCLILASGDLGFAMREAPVELRYFRPDGESLIRQRWMNAWTFQLLSLEELFPELPTFSPDGYGWIRVASHVVDLNGISITQRPSVHSVAIQHLWGQ